ncbi:cupin domain-containing protein [Simiduia curdlanivorans]|uniref:JmjC domain-containing protein n=1 Tax=Simiduia curdlanivorans TaxID=1492769 RepID=A0ABV8V7H0_9GAMM|nr:cupin domain-containing protein [Simiduia curdlanivorans]MDN3639831.1 cupin domain-containing protein [Simiduia curdlanivorans]
MALTQLGEISLSDFFENYWQKKPCLIRNGLANWENPLFPDELAGLALEEDVESRLVLELDDGKPWQLKAGPFSEEDFNQLPDTGWTLLVQAVDHWVPEVTALLDQFRFLPNWRLDDIMVSYAPDGSSVGPHFDFYDVFLIQGFGKRRWQLGQTCDENSEKVEGTPLNILRDFDCREEFILEPGDILYVPPQIAHWGIAEGECMTYSVGFRAPSHAEIIDDFAAEVCQSLPDHLRYQDSAIQTSSTPGVIDTKTIETLGHIIQSHLNNPAQLAQWFGKYMTEPKYDPDAGQVNQPSKDDIAQAQAELVEHDGALFQAPDARFACHQTILFVNGKSYHCGPELAFELANNRAIPNWHEHRANADSHRLLLTLVASGALWLEDPLEPSGDEFDDE